MNTQTVPPPRSRSCSRMEAAWPPPRSGCCEPRLRLQLVIGSSAGAINAVAFAADPTAAGVAELKPGGFGYTGEI